mmetsp:Transcript_3997/g.11341  ORF Transcript_3997/g.11341 Transcript_3997/m.11341 type:complete len:206 (+) Transcript_3997:371-988(+)
MSATAAPARQASAASTPEATSTLSKLSVISAAVCAAARTSLFLFNVIKLLGYHKAAYVTVACVALVLVVAWGVYSLFDEDGATAIKKGSFLLAESEAKWFRKTAFSWEHVKVNLFILDMAWFVLDVAIAVMMVLEWSSYGGATPRTEIKILRKSNFTAPDSHVKLYAQVRRCGTSSRRGAKSSTSSWRPSSYAASSSTTSWMVVA